MKNILFTFAFLLGSLVAAAAVVTEDDEGSFVVSYPGVVSHDSKDMSSPMGTLRGIMTLCENDTGAYSVSYTDFPIDKVIPSLEDFYQKSLATTVTDQNLKLLSQQPCKTGDVPGLDYTANFLSASAVTHARIFLVGHRCYIVGYVGPLGSESSKNATDFLNSFRILR